MLFEAIAKLLGVAQEAVPDLPAATSRITVRDYSLMPLMAFSLR